MSLLHHPALQRFASGTFIEPLWLGAISKAQIFLLNRHKDRATVKLIRKTRRERSSLQTAYEQYMVHSLTKAYCHLPGDMAEVGVFQGASARLICEAKRDRTLHVFDTFEGLPSASCEDRGVHTEKLYACSLESVQAYLQGYSDVHYYKGYFPQSAEGLEERKFSFVHCDVDLYESTLACLNYFYPRMIVGGVILSHDYSLLAGVKTAFEEFTHDKLERPIELPSTQCMLVKI
jgi:O-methyltransferase